MPTRRISSGLGAGALLGAAASVAVAQEPPSLVLLDSRLIRDKSIGFDEPSGLALAPDGASLWSVSDDTRAVFRLGLDGRAAEASKFDVPSKDLEGIAIDAARDRLIAVREKNGELFVFRLSDGELLLRRRLSEMAGWYAVSDGFEGSSDKKGLEGVAVESRTGVIHVLKEGGPPMMLAISPELDRILDHRILDAEAGFRADGVDDGKMDVSGVAHDPERSRFWIVSDRARAVFLYDWERHRAESAPLKARIDGEEKSVKNAEGVAVDPAAGRLYVVSDDGKDSRLLVYEIRQP